MFTKRRFSSFHAAAKRSSALIITLAALLLISILLLVFFDLGTLNREISFSSAGQFRAEQVAQTAVDTTIGDLRNEIIAGSSPAVALNAGTNLYLPLSTSILTNATQSPCRVDDQGFANLVAQSAGGSNFWTGAAYPAGGIYDPVRSAAGNNTQTPSLNGRYVSPNRWNKPGLLGDPGSGSTPTLPNGYSPPDWVVVTRRGALTNAASALPSMTNLANKATNNLDFAVGRYAYTIYNEGALLDANVAGFPQGTASTFGMERGLLPQVDLANLLGTAAIGDGNASADAAALVQWRNRATATSAANYTNYVFSTTNGFTSVGYDPTNPALTDQAFTSRQDLIDYVKNNSTIPTAALSFLGTSTLDLDQPSYYPDPARPKVSTSGSQSDDNLNPNVNTITVQTAFLRASDNTMAVVGEPLLKHRFPVSRLNLFNSPSTNAALIQKYFCMTAHTDGTWDYVDPDTGAVSTTLPTIKTLAQVAASRPGREPSYWELLQAGILTGSLGVEASVADLGCTISQNLSTTRQIFEIGLSLIDQYDADDNPTVLYLGGTSATSSDAACSNLFIAGVENLPYISWIAQQHFRDNISTVPSVAGVPQSYYDGYLMFMIWNPHRNSAQASPGIYRIRAVGSTAIELDYTPTATNIKTTYISPTVPHTSTTLEFQTTTGGQTFSQITPLMPSSVFTAGTTSDAEFAPASTPLEAGIFMGQVTAPTSLVISNSTPTATTTLSMLYPNQTMDIILEKQVGSNWVPYEIFPRYSGNLPNNGYHFTDVTAQMNEGHFDSGTAWPLIAPFVHSDPRSNRFGLSHGGGGAAAYLIPAAFNLITASGQSINFTEDAFSIKPPFSTTLFCHADYAYNQTSDPHSYYTDRDGVVRKGDSNPASTASHGIDSPFSYTTTKTSDAQPIVLNRPFTSVAEMGYAFRDDPWRSLNFSSRDSADGGLLDLFCLTENDNANRAGVVDVNNASVEVLTALLENAYRDPSPTNSPLGTPLAASDAATIAQAIRTQLGPRDAPSLVLKNVSDLPLLTSEIAGSLPDTFKYKREAVARSLADVMNTRTWNLMIDVIAQAGRYTSTSKTLDDFVVAGERRYWVHVAIDRLTGRVVATQVEPVTE